MEKQELEDYLKLGEYIAALEQRIRKLEEAKPPYQFGSVKGSNPDFPYEPRSFHVAGYNILDDERHRQKVEQLRRRLEKKKEEAIRKQVEIQDWIESIPDLTLKLIFTYRYLEGMELKQIAKKLHMDRSSIGKKINSFLQLSPNSPNSPV